ncbi:MAG: efflux RND transporter permease subunit [Bacteroidota bacterium]|nr:efflux RND transporter permease subunit [Bacteroidota bacterium]MDP3147344.1 efflux RND transporter permease subunit [Bacteroidota bacterium]
MLNRIIKFSLSNRLIIMAFSIALMVAGAYTALQLPVDVLPDLNRPRVTIFLEAGGMASEEVEALVVLPVETSLNGATGVEQVRSNSTVGLGMIFVEFDYGTDIMKARQIVAEKLQTIQSQLPDGITPVMGPISSVMGQIMLIGLSSDTTSQSDLRTLADYTIRRRLLSVKGVSQVIPIGGNVLQYQVLISLPRLNAAGLSLNQVEESLRNSNLNTTGNFFNRSGTEILIRNLGRLRSLEEMQNIVVGYNHDTPVLLSQVADVQFGARLKRGDGSMNGKPAVILSVEKQPNASTVELTDNIVKALDELKSSLPGDVTINTELFRQSNFIISAIKNVEEALRDGAILVIIILFLFLLNFRTTLISLIAIPVSLVVTALVFKYFGIGINTMTLGGLAIAIGELVDDAVVDVENVFRRLRENKHAVNPKPAIKVIYDASSEVRNSIVYATIIVVLVFIPLFALSGMEGKIFAPLGIAYITSIIASLFISLTLTPAMCYYLLPNMKQMKEEKDSFLVRWLKKQDTKLLNYGLSNHKKVLTVTAILFLIAASLIPFFGTEFLPPFNEGSLTINIQAEPGTSLDESNKIGTIAEQLILKVPEVSFTGRRTGRAELDEHAEGVHYTEMDVAFKNDKSQRSRDEIMKNIRDNLALLPGVAINIGQPISHRLDHLLSGVRAQVAIKVFGNDLMELRKTANEIKNTMTSIRGVVDLQVERQVQIPQLLIRVKEGALRNFGMKRGDVVKDLESLFQGTTVSQMLDGQKRFDMVIKLSEDQRNDITAIENTLIETPSGGMIPVKQVADIYEENGPNTINHENTQRRIIVSCNIAERDLGGTVQEIQDKIKKEIKLPQGYFITYGGQFESQKSASKLILILSIFSLIGIFLVLYSHFKSGRIVLQIMLNIPLALIGSVVAVMLTGGTFSIASMVGFITLTGIASRNGIMMISHYIHLVEHEGEQFDKKMIIRGSLERLVPVLMTALVAALALIPLTLDKTAPGKEILYPVATVILGGLLSSTLLDMIVTPIVFHLFGEKALKKYLKSKQSKEL